MRLRLTAIVPVAIVLVTATNVMAELKLPAMFTSGAVLQQKMPVPVWGTANPGDKVSVEFAGQQKTATADQDGKWIVKLDSLKIDLTPVNSTSDYERIHPGRSPERIISDVSETLWC